MSLYTTEVRYICEEAAGLEESVGFSKINEILSETWDKVIPQEWPIFDESYRSVLCQKILKHYYTREIGFETVGLWKLKLETKLNEIMPYFNELYKTKMIEFDPLLDVNYFREHAGSDGGETNTFRENYGEHSEVSSGSSNSSGERTDYRDEGHDSTGERHDIDVYSDTPQGALTNVINNNYLTNARKVDTETGEEGGSSSTLDSAVTNDSVNENETSGGNSTAETGSNCYSNTDEYLDHVYGKMNHRTYMSIIKELREIIINIDLMIIDSLGDLFMLLWR